MKSTFIVLLSLVQAAIFAQFLERPNIAPPFSPEHPSVFGVEFGSPPPEVVVRMGALGLKLEKISQQGPSSALQTYAGTPKEFGIRGKRSFMSYFNQELVQIRFSFLPSYKSYLQLKALIKASLGKRYMIDKPKESMDPFIEAKLIAQKTMTEADEKEILKSVQEGKSYFYIPIKDKEKKISAVLRFVSSANGSAPILTLDYSWEKGVKEQAKARGQQQQKKTILPE